MFVKLDRGGPSLENFLGADLIGHMRGVDLGNFHWVERRRYTLGCNWKVFVDNYLDGGYHVPYLHRGLDSVLDYGGYTIETGERFSLQSSPVVAKGAEAQQAPFARATALFTTGSTPTLLSICMKG